MTNDSVRRLTTGRWVAIPVIIASVLTAACGSSSLTAPSPAQIAGVWLGEQTVTSVIGGECVADLLHGFVSLPSQFHATFVQSGTSLTATVDVDHLGAVCTYAGNVAGDTFDLHTTACTSSQQTALQCSSGALRDVRQVSETLHGTIRGDTITGVAVENDMVFVSGTTAGVAPLTFNAAITLTRQ